MRISGGHAALGKLASEAYRACAESDSCSAARPEVAQDANGECVLELRQGWRVAGRSPPPSWLVVNRKHYAGGLGLETGRRGAWSPDGEAPRGPAQAEPAPRVYGAYRDDRT